MLVEFSVKNYRSILERQTLSMVASAYYSELKSLNTFVLEQNQDVPRLLRSSVLYGPNASGKSTLIQALRFMQEQVLESHKETQVGDAIDVVPFKLTAASRQEDSEFVVTFVEKSIRYEYGFCCNSERFTEEWLIAYPKGRAQKWFHRAFDPKANKENYKFSPSFLGKELREIWAAETRPNALFLSKTNHNNNAQLRSAFEWFKQRLRVIGSSQTLRPSYTKERCKNPGDKKKITEFMNYADSSISDIQLEKKTFDPELLPKEMPASVKDQFIQRMAGTNFTTVKFTHPNADGQGSTELEEDEESEGTRALFAFAGPWLDVIESDLVLVVDELDTSLHPLLVRHLVGLLHHKGKHAQLIFTTHDTTLLSRHLLRRDQIWFVEKTTQSTTRLYPLSDFSARENEAIERGYLNGRYGAIPFLKDLDFYGV